MVRRLIMWSCVVAMVQVASSHAQTDADLAVLREFKVEPTAAGVLEFMRKRTPQPDKIKQVDGFIALLGDEEYSVREKATRGLVDLGAVARAKLTAALQSADAEVKKRARYALDRITPPSDDSRILPAVARVLAVRKPPEGAEALLNLLPHIESAEVADETAKALAPLALDKDGKPLPVVLVALASTLNVQRAAAGSALASGAEENKNLARKLLGDTAVGVRRRVALALVEARDAKALPTLVELVGSESEEDSAAAEDALFAVAGEKSPEGPPAEERDPRGASRKIWEKWLKGDGAKIDLTKVEFDAPGSNLTLMGSIDFRAGAGVARRSVVSAMDNSGVIKWKVEVGSQFQMHASMAKRDRILVSEYNYSRVQEYDLKGKVHWTYNVANPIAAYRLRNGNTFVATRNSLTLLDREKKVTRTVTRPGYDIASAYMFDDGRMSIMTTNGMLIRYDREGKEAGSVNTGRFLNVFSRVQFNADGSFIAPDNGNNVIRSYDKDGKQKWEAAVANFPTFVTTLPNGNILVGSRNTNQIVELDRSGKEVRKRTGSGSQVLFLERR